MRAPPTRLAWVPALLASAVVLSTCGRDGADPTRVALPPSVVPAEAMEDQLEGTWLREYEGQGVEARRVLILAPDRSFRETVRATGADGASIDHVHEGTWLFDGTNLKRKYTLMNGEPPSRLNLPFATFQIAFESRDEFVGLDHIRGHRIRYRRVAPETLP